MTTDENKQSVTAEHGPGWIDEEKPPKVGTVFDLGGDDGRVVYCGLVQRTFDMCVQGFSADTGRPFLNAEEEMPFTIYDWNANWGDDAAVGVVPAPTEATEQDRTAVEVLKADGICNCFGDNGECCRFAHLCILQRDPNRKTGADRASADALCLASIAFGQDKADAADDEARPSSPSPSNPQSEIRNSQSSPTPTATTYQLPIDVIEVGEQPRKRFEEAALFELGESIKADGLLQPVLVHQTGDEQYVLIAGERRLRAAKSAGKTLIEARVYAGLAEVQIMRMQLAENIKRADLDPIEEAEWIEKIAAAGEMSSRDVAADTGWSEDKIARRRNLLKLPRAVRDLVAERKLPVHQATELTKAGLDDDQRIELAGRAVRDRMSESQVREAVNDILNPPLPMGTPDGGGDDWRGLAVRETLGLRHMTAQVLAEHSTPIETLGALADWQKAKGEFWAKDIKGLGQGGRDEIETAWEQFWADRGQLDAPAETQTPAETASADDDGVAGTDEHDQVREDRRRRIDEAPTETTTVAKTAAERHETAKRESDEAAKRIEVSQTIRKTPVVVSIAGSLSGSKTKGAKIAGATVTIKVGSDVKVLPDAMELVECPGLEEMVKTALKAQKKKSK